PIKTRSRSPRDTASFRVSTSPIRTVTENFSSSRMKTSASVAPWSKARRTTCSADCFKSRFMQELFLGAADSNLPDLDRGQAHGNRHGLTLFSTNADALVQFQIISDH